MAQFSDAKVGDRVWSIKDGWGKIYQIDHPIGFPIAVDFENESSRVFTTEGKETNDNLNPTLFWDEVKIVPPERPKERCEACEIKERVEDRGGLLKEALFFLLNQHHTCGQGE